MRITISASRGVDPPMLEVLRDGLALRSIPAHEQTPELCLAAVRQNGLALEYVGHKSEAVCVVALRQNGLALKFVPGTPTPQQVQIAVRHHPPALAFVPQQLRSIELCLDALARDRSVMQYVPAELFAEVRIAFALRKGDLVEATTWLQHHYQNDPQAALEMARRHGVDLQVIHPRGQAEPESSANHPRQERGG